MVHKKSLYKSCKREGGLSLGKINISLCFHIDTESNFKNGREQVVPFYVV